MQTIRNFEDLSLVNEEFIQCAAERSLIAEVIFRAMRDVLNKINHGDDSYYRREAALWMRLDIKFRKGDAKKPFSFVWCCNHLEICPYRVREIVREFRKVGVKMIV